MTMAVVAGVAAVASVGLGVYEASQQSNISGQALGLAKNTQSEQEYYNEQLKSLIANPNAFFSSAQYQASFNQGVTAVERGNAATNPPGPGQAAALQTFGQSFGEQQLMSQEQLLASLSGATAASSPASSLGAATGAAGQAGNTLGGTLASLGFTMGLYNQSNSNPGFFSSPGSTWSA